MSWSAAALSDSLEAKERLLIGLKFLNATCKPTFFSAGKSNAYFHASGKWPDINERLTIEVRKGSRMSTIESLRKFAPIATAHPYSARKFTCHVMYGARALSTKMNNDRADGHWYSFAWI